MAQATTPGYRQPAPGAERFRFTNVKLEDFLRRRNSGEHLEMKPENITAARQGLEEWYDSPDRNCLNTEGGGSSATRHLLVRLSGAGVPMATAEEIAREEIVKRFHS